MEVLDVSYSVWTQVVAANPGWPIYYVTKSKSKAVITGHADVMFKAGAFGADKADFESNHEPGATLQASEDDAKALLIGLNTQAAEKDTQGHPVIALSPYAYANESTTFKGFKYTAAADSLSIFDEKLADNLIYVQGVEHMWIANPHEGDYMEFSLVDKDDVLGLFSTYGLTVGVDVLELKKYAQTFHLPTTPMFEMQLLAKTAAAVTGGLYVRSYYFNSHATEDVKAGVFYRWYE